MNRFQALIAAFLVPLALVLSACGINSGTVIDKEYTEAYTEQKKVYEYNCYPAVRSVTYYVDGQPRQRLENYQDCRREWEGEWKDVYHEPEWHFKLENREGDTGKVKVTEDDYNSYDVGDYYDAEDDS